MNQILRLRTLRTKFFVWYDGQLRKAFKKDVLWLQYHENIIYSLNKVTRKALVSKQKDFKRQGKGNKPNAFSALSEDDIAVLYEKDLFGTSSPEALLNTFWFNNAMHFGLRGCKEHSNMTWGYVNLHKLQVARNTWN